MSTQRILVVDDDELVLRAWARALSEIPGAEIIQQKRSRRAAELLASRSFDLLVSDVLMPEMSGVELLKVAHQHDPDLPVILITGFPDPSTAAECFRNGAAAFLVKPILPDPLLDTVYRVLERGRSEKRP
jgi:DNA-binding NtrC family response regulator